MIAKGQKRFEGFDEKIIAMYARGMRVREIAGFLLDHDQVEVSADFISTVIDSVLNRRLEHGYLMQKLVAHCSPQGSKAAIHSRQSKQLFPSAV